jgi:POT family proton-dependent oligopeptide transporter
VNYEMIRPVTTLSAEAGSETWVALSDVSEFVVGQKIDFGGGSGLMTKSATGEAESLKGTYLVQRIDEAGKRVELMDAVYRKPIATTGTFAPGKASVTTYRLVGPEYFNFFAALMAGVGLLFIVVAYLYKEQSYLRPDDAPPGDVAAA